MTLGSCNLAHEVIADVRLVVSCQNREFPTDAEWDCWLADCEKLQSEAGEFRLLVVTEGGHPTKSQVDRVKATKRSNPRTAIVSPSLGFRFMAAAMTFINPTIRTFSSANYDQAFDHIDVPHGARARVREVVERLNQQLASRSTAA